MRVTLELCESSACTCLSLYLSVSHRNGWTKKVLNNCLIDFYNIDNKGGEETYLVSVLCAFTLLFFHIIVINIIILILFVNVLCIGLLHNAALGFDLFQAVKS